MGTDQQLILLQAGEVCEGSSAARSAGWDVISEKDATVSHRSALGVFENS